jgi:uncharacterized protein (TIGR03435 family)
MPQNSSVTVKASKLALLLFASSSGVGQPGQALFEAAAIKPSAMPSHGAGCTGGPGGGNPGQWTCRGVSLAGLVSAAYKVRPDVLLEPRWMQETCFDVVAKVPAQTSRDQFAAMQQNLLLERFKLRLHHEQRATPLYVLTVAPGGPKMKKSRAGAAEDQRWTLGSLGPSPSPEDLENFGKALQHAAGTDRNGFPVPPKGHPGFAVVNGRAGFNSTNYSIDELATFLTGQMDRRVVNSTGLRGTYDVTMYWVQDWVRESNDLDSGFGPTLIRAIRDQLGLGVEPRRGRADFIVVDSAARLPTEN